MAADSGSGGTGWWARIRRSDVFYSFKRSPLTIVRETDVRDCQHELALRGQYLPSDNNPRAARFPINAPNPNRHGRTLSDVFTRLCSAPSCAL